MVLRSSLPPISRGPGSTAGARHTRIFGVKMDIAAFYYDYYDFRQAAGTAHREKSTNH